MKWNCFITDMKCSGYLLSMKHQGAESVSGFTVGRRFEIIPFKMFYYFCHILFNIKLVKLNLY
jgi:hypothetical protein